jgi:putative glycosyltransferase (TIGR04348 family)
MRIHLVTPYLPDTRTGNAHTALRWRRFLRAQGHAVSMATGWDGAPADLLIALHARRSHAPLRHFAETCPDRPRLLMLTGTDLYRDIHDNPEAQDSLELAQRLVVLQEKGGEELPQRLRDKVRVIYQSSPLRRGRRAQRHLDVCVAAHLRDEKAPFLTAEAAALLPAASRVRVRHVGGELQAGMADRARAWQQALPRWRWLGLQAPGVTRRHIADCHLLVISSVMEGGANVIAEAVMAGTPVLASRIAGNVGMLGDDYPGYFPLGDASALAAQLRRCETEPAFLAELARRCALRAPLFTQDREAAAIHDLLAELAGGTA